jgi:hypothetical protein
VFIRHQGNQSLILGLSTLGLLIGATATPSFGYGFYQYGNGRKDYGDAGRYDLLGTMFPSQANSIYDFGNIGGFNFTDPNLPAFFQNVANVTTAVVNAGNAWEPWANINFGNALGNIGTGLVNLRFINTVNGNPLIGAYTWGFQHPHLDEITGLNVTNNYAEIVFGREPQAGVAWNADNFQWIAFHELGHVLGLRDLYDDQYTPLAEEFVDHPVDKTKPTPDRPAGFGPEPGARGYSDNVMFQNRFDGVDYSKPSQTIVDNDEIAGLTWLWSSSYNQIVTGELSNAWNGARRGAVEHHGDEPAGPLKTWTYRGSIVTSVSGVKPYVDIEFPGYIPSPNEVTGYPNTTTWTCQKRTDNLNIVRCEAGTAGWTGNFKLKLESEFSDERRVRAWVNGGQEDKFVLPINTQGLVDGSQNRSWPVVFGPTGPLRKDFGDAPESYITLLAPNTSDNPNNSNDPSKGGPRYDEGDFQRLGFRWDSEPDGQPTPLANGDDVNLWGIGGPDDEDGVIFGDSWVDVLFKITRPDPNPYQLRAWWDTNYNGVFDHTSELYIDDLLTLAPGIFTKRYNLGFNPKADGLYSRFRLTWDPLDLDVKPFGEYYSKADCNTTDAAAGNCISHGEVEDYVHVPEPSSIFGLLAFGGLGLMGLRKKR